MNKPQSPPASAGHKKRPLSQEEDSSVTKTLKATQKNDDDCSTSAQESGRNGNNSKSCIHSTTTTTSATKKSKKQNCKKMNPDALQLRGTIQQCCSNDDLMTAIQAYDQAVEKGTPILAQCFYNLLALCDGLAERDIHIGTPKTTSATAAAPAPATTPDTSKCGSGGYGEQATKDMVATMDECNNVKIKKEEEEVSSVNQTTQVSISERKRHAFRIKAHMDEMQIPPTEPVYTSLVKLICKTNELDEAEKLLHQAQGVQQCRPKLRMYAPLLMAYCKRGQLKHAVNVWLLLSKQDLQLTEREYASLIQCATKCGNHCLMERVLSDLAEDVLVPSCITCQAVAEWFQCPAARTATVKSDTTTKSTQDNSGNSDSKQPDNDSTSLQDLLKQIRIPQQSFPSPSMGPVHVPIGWTISNSCSIDTRTGILQSGCLKDEYLKPVEISPELWKEMKDANETIVLHGELQQHASQFQGGRKGKKQRHSANDMADRSRHWQQFQNFLSDYTKRNNNKIDIVIDGANVGYYRRSFPDAPKHVDYVQIDWIVEHFQEQNKSVLLIMHSRHFSRSLMPPEFEPLLQKWLKAGILYRTPPGMNDDWFWMHAALYCGPPPPQRAQPTHIGTGDIDAAGGGAITFVVTNDEMRDHHFQMLAQRSFVRWKDRHAIHFSFGDWVQHETNGEAAGNDDKNKINNHHRNRRRQVLLTYPEPYTRRIQRIANNGSGLVVPLPKRGDENRFLDGSHDAPDDSPMEETYLCIRPIE